FGFQRFNHFPKPLEVFHIKIGFRVGTSRIRELGWKPSIMPETGFRRTIDFYMSLKDGNARKL
ncbi:MAG TPA: hypothetical protein VH619_04680, partial [Verrucomicrobiae bacterium]|nr:hypothetical protein [Verrucomicrobiae bacterium]